jgi:hypothetical protein
MTKSKSEEILARTVKTDKKLNHLSFQSTQRNNWKTTHSWLDTDISQENGGLNQVLRPVKPPTCMTVVNSSIILTNEKRNKIRRKIREFTCTIVFILGNVLGLDEWHLPICYQKFWTHHFPWVFLTPVYLGNNNGKTLHQICWHTTE